MSKAARRSRIAIDDAELEQRRKAHAMRPVERHGGMLEKYAKLVGPAHLGAVTHSGAVDWKHE